MTYKGCKEITMVDLDTGAEERFILFPHDFHVFLGGDRYVAHEETVLGVPDEVVTTITIRSHPR